MPLTQFHNYLALYHHLPGGGKTDVDQASGGVSSLTILCEGGA
jgi:hypothetical protein